MNQDLLNQPESGATPPGTAPRNHQPTAKSVRGHEAASHGDTPGSDTPGSDTPGSDTPGSDTPSRSGAHGRLSSASPRASIDPMRTTDRYRLARPLL